MRFIHETPDIAGALFEQVAADIADAAGGAPPAAAHEVARAVAAYACEDLEHARGRPMCIRHEHLGVLTSRALSAVGEGPLAQRVLLRVTGAVRPTEWITWADQAVWSVDLSCLTARPEDCIELVFHRALDAVLETLAGVWDATSGCGALGLCRLARAAARLANAGNTPWQIASDIRHRCAWRMKAQAARRGWKHTPVVLDMDGIGA